jgi:hypothetical protein
MNPLVIPDTGAACEFLRQAQPQGPWHLVAIEPGKGPEAKTFWPSTSENMWSWIEARQGKKNMYWHVNELRPDAKDLKATKRDIVAAHFLHVDVDDPEALERIKAFVPRATAIVFSGGGYQAFWKLTEASTDLERVERCNRWIASQLGGDNCHNIDRIMRLPGTINIPNAKKRAAGRVEVLSYVL